MPPFVAALVLALVPQDAPQVTALPDLTYTTVDGQALKLDLAMPQEGDGPFPAIVVIHGGGWRAGDKSNHRDLLAAFAGRGYVAISPQYRFCPEHVFPAQVHDVKAAVRWLRAHASEYKVDPDHIGAVGFSAGGHLALMLGVTDDEDGLEGPGQGGDTPSPSSRVQAVVNFFGPSDLAAEDIPDASKPLVDDFLGGPRAEKPEETKAASPITYVTADDPPILTFQGTKDPLVPHTQAYKLADALTAAGAHEGRVELLIGAGHGWDGAQLKRTKRLTFAFFDKHLK